MILICVPSGMYRPSAYSSIQPRCRADGWALMVMDGMRWLSLRVRSCCIYECQVIDGSSPDSAWQILRAAATQPAALQLERLRAQETLLPRPSNRRPDGWRIALESAMSRRLSRRRINTLSGLACQIIWAVANRWAFRTFWLVRLLSACLRAPATADHAHISFCTRGAVDGGS